MAGDDAAGLREAGPPVGERATVGMAKGATGGPQHRLGCRHVPILRGGAAGKGNVNVGFAAQNGGNLATHTAHGTATRQPHGLQERLQPRIPVAATRHQHQFAAGRPPAQLRLPAAALPVFAPAGAGHDAEPELVPLRNQHGTQQRLAAVQQRQMYGVLAGTLQKILRAVQRIQDPYPLSCRCTRRRPGTFLAQHAPASRREVPLKQPEQVAVHRQVGRGDGAVAAAFHAQHRRVAERWLPAAGIGPQNIGRIPEPDAQQLHQPRTVDTGRQNARD